MPRPKDIDKMSMEALVELRDNVALAISRRIAELQQQLSRVTDAERAYVNQPNTERPGGTALKGRKIAAKYRSKKDPTLTWAGRGATPRWMREEMKSGLKKDAFLIQRA